MSLAAWQDALVALVVDGEPGTADDLDVAERTWFDAISGSAGLRLTRRVHRDWRAFRIRTTLPLTARLLGDRFDALVAHHLDAHRQTSSFYVAEAEAFVASARHAWHDTPHADAVARFELAMHHAVQHDADRCDTSTSADIPTCVRLSPHAALIGFDAPVEHLLAALAAGAPPPPPSDRRDWLLCAPRACRRPSPAERDVLAHVQRRACRTAGLDRAAVAALWVAGALEGTGP